MLTYLSNEETNGQVKIKKFLDDLLKSNGIMLELNKENPFFMKNLSIVFILFFSLQAFAIQKNNSSFPLNKASNEKSTFDSQIGFSVHLFSNDIAEIKVNAESQFKKRKKKNKKPVNQITKKGKKKNKKSGLNNCHKW